VNKGAWACTYYIAQVQMHQQGGALMGTGQDATATLKQPSIGKSWWVIKTGLKTFQKSNNHKGLITGSIIKNQ